MALKEKPRLFYEESKEGRDGKFEPKCFPRSENSVWDDQQA